MKISVLVPAYNEEKLLRASLRCIKSAAQSFRASGADWEMIVCDNSSSDRTAEIAREKGRGWSLSRSIRLREHGTPLRAQRKVTG